MLDPGFPVWWWGGGGLVNFRRGRISENVYVKAKERLLVQQYILSLLILLPTVLKVKYTTINKHPPDNRNRRRSDSQRQLSVLPSRWLLVQP